MKLNNGKNFYLLLEKLESRLLLDSTVLPTDYAQYMLELINRARLNPEKEAALYQIDLNEGVPPENTISTNPTQPLAFNLNLMDAANQHSQWMLDNNTFSHTGAQGSSPHSRMVASEYVFATPWASGENLAWLGMWPNVPNMTDGAAQLHENLFVDEDYPDRGHRVNMLYHHYKEVGIGLLPGLFTLENQVYNSVIVTTDFALTAGDSFLTGVVYDDQKRNDNFYTPGEGKGGLTITALRHDDRAEFTTRTWSSGGYTLPLPAGTYQVYVSTSGSEHLLGGTIIMENSNVKTDFPLDILQAPEISVGANSRNIKSGDATPSINDHTDFGNVDVDREIITNTYIIRNPGKGTLGITDVQISGPHASEFELLTPPSATVAPGSRTTFELRFDPLGPGLRSATVSIINNDSNENPYTFMVQGAGVYKPELMIDSVQYPAGAYFPQDSFTWGGTIFNQGSGDVSAAAPFMVEARLSANRLWNDADDIVLTPAFLQDNELKVDQSRQISQPVSIPSEARAGTYYLGVMIDSQENIDEISETNNIWWSDTADVGIQNLLSLEGAGKMVFSDVNGKRTTFSLKGPGRAEILVPASADAFEIVLNDTAENSKFRITIAGRIEKTVRNIVVNGPIKEIISKKTDLLESIDINGSLGKLYLDDISENAIITVAAGINKGLTLKADQIGENVLFDIDGPVRLFKADQIGDSVLFDIDGSVKLFKADQIGENVQFDIDGSVKLFKTSTYAGGFLHARDIGKIKITQGAFNADVEARQGNIQTLYSRGDIGGKITAQHSIGKIISLKGDITGVARAGHDIGKVSAMNLDGALISAGNDIKKVLIRWNISDSYILTGYDIGSDGAFGLQEADGDDSPGSGDIGLVSVKGLFARSYVCAGALTGSPLTDVATLPVELPYSGDYGTIGKVKLGDVDYQNATQNFGLFAATQIAPFKIDGLKAEPKDYFRFDIIS